MNKSSKIALGILGAAAVGVIIGGLFYTEKGKEIRQQIGNKASDAKNSLADLYNRGKQKVSDTASQMSRKANGVKNSAEDVIG
jgi:gas vesicle protein